MLEYLLVFLAIVAVLYVIYAGVRILTSGGNEEAMKEGKKNIISVVIGIILIFLAYSIVRFIIDTVNTGDAGTTVGTGIFITQAYAQEAGSNDPSRAQSSDYQILPNTFAESEPFENAPDISTPANIAPTDTDGGATIRESRDI